MRTQTLDSMISQNHMMCMKMWTPNEMMSNEGEYIQGQLPEHDDPEEEEEEEGRDTSSRMNCHRGLG